MFSLLIVVYFGCMSIWMTVRCVLMGEITYTSKVYITLNVYEFTKGMKGVSHLNTIWNSSCRFFFSSEKQLAAVCAGGSMLRLIYYRSSIACFRRFEHDFWQCSLTTQKSSVHWHHWAEALSPLAAPNHSYGHLLQTTVPHIQHWHCKHTSVPSDHCNIRHIQKLTWTWIWSEHRMMSWDDGRRNWLNCNYTTEDKIIIHVAELSFHMAMWDWF